MAGHSMLYERTASGEARETPEAPAFFPDLNLDQVVDAITAGRKDYNLKPFFFTPLQDEDTIHYRHEILQDLEAGSLLEHIRAFAQRMIVMHRYLGLLKTLDYRNHKAGWFLEAALVYCEAVTGLAHDLDQSQLRSRGFIAFHAYVTEYTRLGRLPGARGRRGARQSRALGHRLCGGDQRSPGQGAQVRRGSGL